MPGLARDIRNAGCRPGVWLRPLLTHEDLPEDWTIPNRGNMPTHGRILDPSVPEVIEKIRGDIRRLNEWSYELIKHDFSTFDLFAKWGFEMGGAITAGSWKFRDDSRTTAEIIGAFYRAVREGAGEALVIGCNTIGHLGAGLFDIQRTGDDTSGKNWERTRRMGVNTLAFRMAQQGAFFAADADCVGLTGAVPWELNRQWLKLLAASGTPLFVSADPAMVGAEQKAALEEAFALASQPLPPAEPLDWMETTSPEKWKIGGKTVTFDWSGTGGVSPFIMA
jgi:alpha-galactosidase